MSFNNLHLIPIILLLSFCKSAQYTPDNLPERRLVFGKGGGFSGAVNEYTLLENGQLFVAKSLVDTIEELPPVKRKTAKAIFEETEALDLDTLNFNHPGNLYYYLHYKNRERACRVTWGDYRHEVPASVKSLYHELIQLPKKEK